MTSLTPQAALRRPPPRLRLAAATVSLALLLMLTTLKNNAHLFLFAAPLLGMFWLVATHIAPGSQQKNIRVTWASIVICGAVSIVATTKLATSLLYANTTGAGIITSNTFANRWAGDMLWAALLFIVIVIFTNAPTRQLQRAIRIIFAIHVVAFLAQLIVFYFNGYVLDFSSWLGGDSARTAYFEFFRPSGLLVEPSTFAGVTILLLACDSLLANRISKRMLFITAGAAILSLSTAAWAFAGVLLLAVLPIMSNRRVSRLLLILGCVIGIILIGTSQYGRFQFTKFNSTSGLRANVVSYAIHHRPPITNVFGPVSNGVGVSYLNGFTGEGRSNIDLAAVSDEGTAVYLFLLYGAMGVVVYLALLLYAYRRLPKAIFVLLVLATLTKVTPAVPAFTVLLAAASLPLQPVQRRREPALAS